MAISSPNVVRSATPNQNQIVQAAGVAQRGASDLMNRRQRQREFTAQMAGEFAQMDPNQRIMLARQNPDLISSVLRETNLSGEEADALTDQMAQGLLSADAQAELAQATITALGGYTGAGQPQEQEQVPQPQPEELHGPRRAQPNIQQPGFTRGMQKLPTEARGYERFVSRPSPRGGTQQGPLGVGEQSGQGVMEVETFDPSTSEGQFFNYTQSLFRPAGSGDWAPVKVTDIVKPDGSVDYEQFQRAYPKPENTSEWQQKFPEMDQDQYTRLRAYADIQMQKAGEEIKSQAMGVEDLIGAGSRFVQPENITADNLESAWMFDEDLSAEQVRQIQGQNISAEEMVGKYFGIKQEQIDKNFREQVQRGNPDYSIDTADAVINPATTMNKGQRKEFGRRIEKAMESVRTGGNLELNENLSDQQLKNYTRSVDNALGYMDRGLPKSAEEARQRANAALDYSQSVIETYTGAEGQQAYVEARNFLQGNAYLEAQLMMEQNKTEIQRMLAEHNIDMDKAELALQVQAFELDAAAREAQAGVETVDQAKSFLGEMRQTAVELLPEDVSIADMDQQQLAKTYDENPVFRTSWNNYMKGYAKYMQLNGFNVEYNTEKLQYGGFFSIGQNEVAFPTVGTPQSPEQQDVYGQLSPDDQQFIQQINTILGQ